MVARRVRVLAGLMAVVLVAAACDPVRYVYDDQGRLKGVIDPGGDTAVYTYDDAGNIVGIDRYPSDEVSIVGFAPRRGNAGDEVAIQGTGFGAEDDEVIENTVEIGGVQAEVTSESGYELKVIVPEGVTTGPITVTTPTGSATSDEDFTVETDLAPVISGFTPTVVGAGDEVTITGSNFFGDVAFGLDTVSINGGYASLVSATSTELVVTVPETSSSGQITVSTPEGTTVSADDLFVAPPGFTAADVGSTGRAAIGEPTTVSIDTAGQIGLLVFDGEAQQRVSVHVEDDQFSSCEPEVSLLAPGGARLGRLSCSFQTIDLLEPVTLPADGTYTVFVDPGTTTGSIALTVHDVDDVSGPILPGGDPVEVVIDTPGQNAALSIDGEAGERLSLDITDSSFSSCSPAVRVIAPDGTELGADTCVFGAPNFIDTMVLLEDGEHRVLVDPTEGTTGSVTLQLFEVPEDVSGSITPGGDPVVVDIGTPGQDAELTFSGSVDDRVSLNITDSTFSSSSCSPEVRVIAPDETELGADTCVIGASNFIDTMELPAEGEYQVVVDPDDNTTGSVTLQLFEVPEDVSGSITPGGDPVVVDIGTPGQDAELTFSGAVGDRVSLDIRDDSFSVCSPEVRIFAPDETELEADTCVTGTANFIDTLTLDQDGEYRVVANPTNETTGSVTLELFDVPADVSGSITPGGDPVVVDVGTPGQDAELTFSGSVGDRVSLDITDSTFSSSSCSPEVRVIAPDGTELGSDTCVIGASNFIDTMTLDQDGEHRVVVDPDDNTTGSVTLELFDVPNDLADVIAIDGVSVNVAIGAPGQNAVVSFDASAGANLALDLSGDTFSVCSPDVRVYAPDGTEVGARSCLQGSATVPLDALPQSGTYEILVDPDDATTGEVTLALSTASVAASAQAQEPEASADDATESGDSGGSAAEGSSDEDEASSSVSADEPSGSNSEDDGAQIDLAAIEPASESAAGAEAWGPDREDRETAWEAERPASEWEELPLRIPDDGDTAVSGRVLKLNGRPLAGVTVSLKGNEAETDETGRFLLDLSGVRSGKHELVIHGASANTENAEYGTFVIAVDINEGFPTFIDHTVWMPKLDTENVVELEYPLEEDVVVTTPHIPGLELHIPAGTEVRDREGELVTEVGITPIPVDRPPYPLPETTEIPVYFTIQPGGAAIEPYGTYLVYPNYRDDPPGSWVSFYEYTPELGWYVYGKGEVTADGSQVVPDPSVALTGFTGAMINVPGYQPPGEGPNGDGSEDGDPVDLGTGLFVYEKTDLIVSDILPVSLTRTYRPNDDAVRAFGVGTTWAFDLYMWSAQQYQEADVILPNGQRVHYERVSEGTGFTDAVFEDTGSTTAFNNSRIEWNGNAGWDLVLKDGTTFVFGDTAPLQSIRDRHGNEIKLQRESLNAFGAQTGNIVSITSPHGRWLGFSYDDEGRVVEARDHMGRAYTYAYDDDSRLASVTDPEGGVTSYTYDDQHRMLTVTDPRGINFLTNEYDAEGRVTEQTQADGSTYGFAYTTDAEGDITQTDVTDPRGFVRRLDFDEDGFKTSETRVLGQPDEQTVMFERDPETHVVTAATDPLGRRTAYSYDGSWNLTSVTALEGTADAVTTSFTYEPDFHQIASVTDPLGRVTSYAYDAAGNRDTITDPAGAVTSLDHDGMGRVTSLTDPLGAATSFEYDLLNRVTATDARGYSSSRYMDAGGRPVLGVDPLGERSIVTYDNLNRPVSTVTPDGAETGYAYDPNGNVTSITDPEGATTAYTYDDMDRVTTRTDPVGATDEYVYNEVGQVTRQTDRQGEVTTFNYDPLGRVTDAAFGVTESATESSVTYIYDELGRLTEADDTAYGSIQFGYDDLSRLVTETMPDGQVSYGYNAANERTSMTLGAGPETTYGYDDAGRLVSVARDGLTITATRDDLGRVTTAELPNTVTAAYEYDEVGNLTNVTYDSAADPEETLGGVSYGYDPLGRRVTASGDLAGVETPDPVGTATYDSANRLTERDGVSYTYDAAGNLVDDGTNTYTWNARGQLASVSGPVSAGFTYDPLGRRASKNINGVVTDYRYDGVNAIQTDRVGLVTDYVTGLSVDEVLARVTADGTTTYLSDGLGSTVGLVDETGTVATNYTYGPFGETVVEGDPDPNPFGYTGRELDETGLYFYRARYLQPELGRFISEDPLGFSSGQSNQYSYVANDPMNATDPSGLCGVDAVADAGFLLYDAYKLITDGRKNLGENLAATALDAVGLAVPCATGLGAAGRAATHADDVVDVVRGADHVQDAVSGSRFGDEAADAATWGDDAVDAAAGCLRSFSADTEVLMADGSTKPISEVEAGDWVMAEDPETGERGPREVTHLWVHEDWLVDLEVDGGDAITTTEDHPYWNNTDQEWQETQDLDTGDSLLAADGDLIPVEGIDWTTVEWGLAYNLTVDDLHTYYVETGADEVLVHNDCLSPNQMNAAIRRGQAPRGITRIDTPQVTGEQLHATFEGGAALNVDGTWKHGYVDLTRKQRDWLRKNGWNI